MWLKDIIRSMNESKIEPTTNKANGNRNSTSVHKTKTGKGLVKLTRKQKAFADELINNPKQSATKAVLKTYNVTKASTAGVVANENLKKPSIIKYLELHSDKAEEAIITVLNNAISQTDSVGWQRLAKDTADSILDRVHGKATQKTETNTQNLNINVEASKELDEAFTAFLKQQTTL